MDKRIDFKYLGAVYTLHYIQDQKRAQKALDILMKDDVVYGLDIETYSKPQYVYTRDLKRGRRGGLCPHLSKIRLIQVYDTNQNVLVFDMDYLNIVPMRNFLNKGKFVAHNAQFEQSHLKNYGCHKLDMHCTMIAAMTVDRAERSPYEPDLDEEDEKKANPFQGYSLDVCSAKYFGTGLNKQFQTSEWSGKELSDGQLVYAALDAIVCRKLHGVLYPKIESMGMVRYYNILSKMIPVVSEMSYNGICFDEKKHKALIKKWKTASTISLKKVTKYFGEVNINSGKQMGEWLEATHPELLSSFPKTEKGAYSFNKQGLENFSHMPDFASYLDYKQYSKMLNTYGESLLDFVNPETGRLHSEFSLGETRTGRLSSRNPNFQNFPRDPDFRALFIPDYKKSMVCYDLSQIEIRVGACLSRDPVMMNAFNTGLDLHNLIVSQMSGKDIKSVTKEERQLGKALNFGLMFGMGPTGLKKYTKSSFGVDMSDEEAQIGFNTYHNLYKGYSKWCGKQREYCESMGYITTPAGKRRKLMPEEAYTRSVNCPVQGGAAEALMTSMIILYNRLKKYEGKITLLSTVHDEIIIECDEGLEEETGEIVQQCFIDGCKKVFPNMPMHKLSAGGSGANWAEAK